jgi:nucleoside-diphosphate-sugar epimerase
VILTGASGFVGKNLGTYLQLGGFPVSPVNLRTSKQLNITPGSAIIHLAGKAHDHCNIAKPDEYFQVNTELTKRVFDEFLASSAAVFIHFSTVAAVAVDEVTGLLTEDALPQPGTVYGQSKLEAEQYLLSRALPLGKKLFIIRPAMIHGPGDKGNLTLLYNFVARGIPYPLAAFRNRRSFLSIDNLCFVVEQLLQKAEDVPDGIYNLVDDEPLSTNEVVNVIAQCLGKKCRQWSLPKPLVSAASRLGDILPLPINSARLRKLTTDFVVSNHKIKQALGIVHLPVTAREGLVKTISSFREE